MDLGSRAAANELIASLLASFLGLRCPEPAVVEIQPELVPWLMDRRPEMSRSLSSSDPLNFGSRYLVDVSTWPPGRALPDSMRLAAAEIFAFDALISNDDRRYNNANVLVRGDQIYAIDHEAAFSFLYLLSSNERPWEVRNRRSLCDHVFYHGLRKQPVNLSLFTARLSQLGERELSKIISKVPASWRYDGVDRISAHLKSVRDHAAEFERQLLERLA